MYCVTCRLFLSLAGDGMPLKHSITRHRTAYFSDFCLEIPLEIGKVWIFVIYIWKSPPETGICRYFS